MLGTRSPTPAEVRPCAWFDRGSSSKRRIRRSAEAAYRHAIDAAPDYVDPCLNLGVLLCDAGPRAMKR